MTIKDLRLSMDMSQSQFAARIGMDRSDLGKMENGKKKIPDRVIEKIREVFDVEVSDAAEKQLVKKVSTKSLEIYIQSPLGGNITPEEITAKVPEDAEACFVRVDQNKIWWLRGNGETGYVWIWD